MMKAGMSSRSIPETGDCGADWPFLPIGLLRNIDQVAPAPSKDGQMTAQRIALQHLLHLERQPWKAAVHIGMAGA
jgi:hypothetical protein